MLPLKSEMEKAFTLIEISIVLVIIGLIVGGILTGENLISAARQRATLAQIEKYNTAVNTFHNKFGGIPGDLLYSTAASFGLAATTSGGAGMGDDNGLVQDPGDVAGAAEPNTNTPVGEILLFWRQLSDAGLINGTYGSDITVATAQGPPSINPDIDFPAAKIGRSSYVIVGSDSTIGTNCFGILGLLPNGVTGGAYGTANYYPVRLDAFTPIEAYNMDIKIDDGLPMTGRVQARGNGAGDILSSQNFAWNWPFWTASASSPACAINGAWPFNPLSQVQYNTMSANGGDNVNCELRFQFN